MITPRLTLHLCLKKRGSHVILDHRAVKTIKGAKLLGLKVKTKSDPRWLSFFEVSTGERRLKTHASTFWKLPASLSTMNPTNGIMEATQVVDRYFDGNVCTSFCL
jgi:hypothetical protein